MARATATYSCGHTGDVFGRNRADAASKAKWIEKKGDICSECWNAARLAERQAQNAAAAEEAARIGLPAIVGVSQKQIDFAVTRRQQNLAKIDEISERVRRVGAGWQKALTLLAGLSPEEAELRARALIDAGLAVLANVTGETDASWWLDITLDERAKHAVVKAVKAQRTAMETAGALTGETSGRLCGVIDLIEFDWAAR